MARGACRSGSAEGGSATGIPAGIVVPLALDRTSRRPPSAASRSARSGSWGLPAPSCQPRPSSLTLTWSSVPSRVTTTSAVCVRVLHGVRQRFARHEVGHALDVGSPSSLGHVQPHHQRQSFRDGLEGGSEPALREHDGVQTVREVTQLGERLVQLGLGGADGLGVAGVGVPLSTAASRMPIASSRCCAPSCRSRSSWRRCSKLECSSRARATDFGELGAQPGLQSHVLQREHADGDRRATSSGCRRRLPIGGDEGERLTVAVSGVRDESTGVVGRGTGAPSPSTHSLRSATQYATSRRGRPAPSAARRARPRGSSDRQGSSPGRLQLRAPCAAGGRTRGTPGTTRRRCAGHRDGHRAAEGYIQGRPGAITATKTAATRTGARVRRSSRPSRRHLATRRNERRPGEHPPHGRHGGPRVVRPRVRQGPATRRHGRLGLSVPHQGLDARTNAIGGLIATHRRGHRPRRSWGYRSTSVATSTCVSEVDSVPNTNSTGASGPMARMSRCGSRLDAAMTAARRALPRRALLAGQQQRGRREADVDEHEPERQHRPRSERREQAGDGQGRDGSEQPHRTEPTPPPRPHRPSVSPGKPFGQGYPGARPVRGGGTVAW